MEKYKQIANDLAEKIQSGILAPGTRLSSEKELCEEYQVSRITIKKATDQLLLSGLINKRRGAGTFVKDKAIMADSGRNVNDINFSGFSKQFEDKKKKTEVKLFEVIPARGEVAEALHLDKDQFVYHIIRNRYVDDNPYVIEYTYMPIDVIPGINMQILESSIYSYIQNTLGLKLRSAHRTVRALLPTKEEKTFFGKGIQMAILEVEQVAYLDDGRIFEFSRSHLRGDRYSFQSVSVQ